jgi:hypothetical protein
MANRYLYQFRGSFEPARVTISMKVSIGASGAPTLVSGQNRGVSSIVRNSAGRYTITLQDSYARLLMLSRTPMRSSPSASPETTIIADNSATLAAPTIVIQCSAAGVATDPANGETMMIQMDLKNSSS